MFYLDSSAWVKRYEREAGTEWIDRLWRRDVSLACSGLGLVEVLSAVIRRHAGRGVLDGVTRRVITDVRADYSDFVTVAMAEDVLALAAAIVETRHLRGADSVHLASAIRLGQLASAEVTLVASDAELLDAARAEGLPILDPRANPPLP